MQPYDVVACSLVLCVLSDQDEYDTALDHLAAAVRPPTYDMGHNGGAGGGGGDGGLVLVAVCNPFLTHHGHSVMQRRLQVGSGPQQPDPRLAYLAGLRCGAAAAAAAALDDSGGSAGPDVGPASGVQQQAACKKQHQQEPQSASRGAHPYMSTFAWTKELRAWPPAHMCYTGFNTTAAAAASAAAAAVAAAMQSTASAVAGAVVRQPVRRRADVHRPLELLLVDCARRGLALEW